MAFDSFYKREISGYRFRKLNEILEKQKKRGELPSGDDTILPFFGFECDTSWDAHVTGSISAKYELRHSYGDTWEVHKIPGQLTGATWNYETFSRHNDHSSPDLKKLEGDFVTLFEKKRKKVWDSTYIYRDLEAYYNRKLTRADKENEEYGALGAIGCLCPILFIPILVAVFVCGLVGTPSDQKPLKNRGEKYINKLRKKYYKTMERAYGKKMGAILKEYSIIRAKKEGKLY